MEILSGDDEKNKNKGGRAMYLLFGNSHAGYMRPFLTDDWQVESRPGSTTLQMLQTFQDDAAIVLGEASYQQVFLLFDDPYLIYPEAAKNMELLRMNALRYCKRVHVIGAFLPTTRELVKDPLKVNHLNLSETRDGLHLTTENYIKIAEELISEVGCEDKVRNPRVDGFGENR
jgi:hypothetical protein